MRISLVGSGPEPKSWPNFKTHAPAVLCLPNYIYWVAYLLFMTETLQPLTNIVLFPFLPASDNQLSAKLSEFGDFNSIFEGRKGELEI